MDQEEDVGAAFLSFLAGAAQPQTRIHILTDSDADGLPSAAILQRALRQAGYLQTTSEVRLKFETAWSLTVTERLRALSPEVLIITDLGSKPQPILPGVPTLLIDHHRPTGIPPGATLISAYRERGGNAIATTGLLAYRCAQALLPEQHPAVRLAGCHLAAFGSWR